MKIALITGVTGQDGSYLAEFLLSKGYEVHGLIRRASSFNTHRLDPIYRDPHEPGVKFFMHYGDLSDSGSLINLIRDLEPDEIYHLGAQSHVKVSFEIPEYTSDATGMGAVRILEAIRASGVSTRFYQAGSSEMFGMVPPPQNERTPLHPRSPYGVSKLFAHWMTVNYREAHGLFACNGVLFNHESLPESCPVMVRINGSTRVAEIGSLVPRPRDPCDGMRCVSGGGGLEVWDGDDWSRCVARTATWREEQIVSIHGRGAIVEASRDHVLFLADGERPAKDVKAGDRLVLAQPPGPMCARTLDEEQAWLLGLQAGEGDQGVHRQRPQEEVRRIERRHYRGWMFDLATESGRFAAGKGLALVHNSPRRGETFVTRKIARAVARIKAGIQDKVYLGNLDARRDWGYAPEYVQGMWLMLQQDEPDDFVIATGESHPVREFAQLAFERADLDWERYVEIDPRYFRPAEVDYLQGDTTKAERILGWRPRTRFEDLVKIMVDADVQLLDDELTGRLVRQDRDH
jgi:GDP-D-mannose dehydratase